MPAVFIIRNQDGHYLTKKSLHWLDGSEPQYLFKTSHEDVALNTLIEYNSKQIDVRAEVVSVETNAKGLPVVEVSEIESKMPAKVKKPSSESEHDQEAEDIETEQQKDASIEAIS